MTRWIIFFLLVAAVSLLLIAYSRQTETPVRLAMPEEIFQPIARTPVVASSSPTPVIPEPTPTPVLSMKRISPSELPPQRIAIPGVKLDAPVEPMTWQNVERGDLTVTEWEIPANAAGYQVGSAFPGQQGNTVLAGHHNIEGKVFENLRHLNPGDQIYLYTRENKFRYIVSDKFLLHELGAPLEQQRQNAQWIGPTADERLTLVTCWPPTGNAYRLIVIAKPAGVAVASAQ